MDVHEGDQLVPDVIGSLQLLLMDVVFLGPCLGHTGCPPCLPHFQQGQVVTVFVIEGCLGLISLLRVKFL